MIYFWMQLINLANLFIFPLKTLTYAIAPLNESYIESKIKAFNPSLSTDSFGGGIFSIISVAYDFPYPELRCLIERFNRTYREDILDMNLFGHLQEVRQLTQDWLRIYNEERPHESLAGLSPIAFAQMRKNKIKLENSTFK